MALKYSSLTDLAKENMIMYNRMRNCDNQGPDGGLNLNLKPPSNNVNISTSSLSEKCDSGLGMDNSPKETYNLILGNLPKNYTIKDVKALVEEAKPVYINGFDETRVFNLKFCHIVLSSLGSLKYLINKLNGFVISGEKLIAVDLKNLIEWKEKVL